MTRKLIIVCFFLFLYLFIQASTIVTNKPTYAPGETITVTFGTATAKTDWVGMYNSAITPGPQNSLAWLYLNGTQTTPAQVIESGTLNFTAPMVAGNYKMCFHPNDGYTVTATTLFTVSTVGIAPVAVFSSSSFVVSPGGTVAFTDQSLYLPTSWVWSFPGGTPSESTVQNPSVQYKTEGTYTVSLTTSNANGSNQLTKTGYITVRTISDKATDVKFMHLNVWVSGNTVPNGLTYIRDIVAAVDPDIVCFVEVDNSSGNWATKMVNELAAMGHYYNSSYLKGSDAAILSKFPITKSGPLLPAVSLFNVDVNGKSMVVAASHLDYSYYACYLPRGYNCGGSAPYGGWSQIGSPDPHPVTDLAAISAQNLGSQRDEQIGIFINYVDSINRPIVIMGDFNEPSHQDWTINQANLFDHNGVVFPWTTTHTLTDNNFTDAFRKIYPDEVLNPGITWPSFATGAGSTSWTPKSDDRDRIDYIFYKGAGVTAINASIVGPKGSYAHNALTTSNTDHDQFLEETMPWPSDHKGVFATITIPAASDSATYSSLPLNSSFDMKIFPNPGFGLFNLVTSENTLAQVSVTSLSGQKVFHKVMKMGSNKLNALDVSYIPAGVYFLNVVTEHGSQTIKIVKQ
ncbi:MAG TPA: endonuclease/exonuclease/phosphatase family protein [Prolixibacteraceae bacterium]|jgi:PKD repeat protein